MKIMKKRIITLAVLCLGIVTVATASQLIPKTSISETAKMQKEIVIEGILSIQSGDNPRILLEKLLSFLPPNEREPVKAESNQG